MLRRGPNTALSWFDQRHRTAVSHRARTRFGHPWQPVHAHRGGKDSRPPRRRARRRGERPGVLCDDGSGLIGLGCRVPSNADDVHLFHDRLAFVVADAAVDAVPRTALFVSSLRARGTPIVLLNTSLGDQATLERRTCGCPLGELGWDRHLHSIRSFEKLTACGMTFLDFDVIRDLEQVLPARFGGVPTDYQLVEDEARRGQPRLRLLVHPRVGPLARDQIIKAFLEAIGPGRPCRAYDGAVLARGGHPRRGAPPAIDDVIRGNSPRPHRASHLNRQPCTGRVQ